MWKQKDELFYYVAIEYLYFKIHGIHAVQGPGGTNEMIVHTMKTNMLLLRLMQLILVGPNLHRDL